MQQNLPLALERAQGGLNLLAVESANISDVVAMAFGLPLAADLKAGAGRDLPSAVNGLAVALAYLGEVCQQASRSLVESRVPRQEPMQTIYGIIPAPEPAPLPEPQPAPCSCEENKKTTPLTVKLVPPSDQGHTGYTRTADGWEPIPGEREEPEEPGEAIADPQIPEPAPANTGQHNGRRKTKVRR